MIGKAQCLGSSVADSFSYAQKLKEVDDKKGIIIDKNYIAGDTANEIAAEFLAFQKLNGRSTKNVISIIISPESEEGKKLTQEQFKEISKEFLKRMKLDDRQSVTVFHPHDSHNHIHCYVNRIDFQGVAYKDNYIGLRAQRVADEIAIDMNLNRAKEIEMAQLIVHQPIIDKINHIYNKVLSDPKTTMKNVFFKFEREGLKLKFSKNLEGKTNGYSVELHGIKRKASEINKEYSLPKLKTTIEQRKLEGSLLAGKEKIKAIFAATLAEKDISTKNFLHRIKQKGVEVLPSVNSQGEIQGYRVKLKGETQSFKASEIGNKYTLAKLENTISKEGGQGIAQSNQVYKSPTLQEKLSKIVSDTICDKNTTAANFYEQLGIRGMKITPIKNDLGEINNHQIRYGNDSFLATDVLLKYSLQNPERLISETRAIQEKEQTATLRNELKTEINKHFYSSLHQNHSDLKSMFTDLKEQGLDFTAIDDKNYNISYKDEKFIASEVNQNFTLDKLDGLRESCNEKYTNQNSNFDLNLNLDLTFNEYAVNSMQNDTPSFNLPKIDISEIFDFGGIYIPMPPQIRSGENEEETEEERRRRLKKKRKNRGYNQSR